MGSGSDSLERYLSRKRLFVRVQANVPRELFVQKLNTAFPGARIGVGNANAERGPVTQRVADVNYESQAEACTALRKNRFKLKIGTHDVDLTYQIERKDVVEKLAGEWGCRFMVVVKNLPPGEISCAELSEMFETAGEIFTIKILPGNRGEPYALVQYVEEQSVELSIQQLNQQKMHGAVLYVERHLKARRQGGGSSGNSHAAAPPAASPTSPAAQPPSPAAQQPPAAQPAATSAGGARPTATAAAAAAVVATAPQAAAAAPAPAAAARSAAAASAAPTQQQQHTQQQAAQASPVAAQAAPALAPPPPAPPLQHPVVMQITVPPNLSSPVLSPTASVLSPTAYSGAHQHLGGTAPVTPSSQPAKPALDSSSSLFSNQYMPKQDVNGHLGIPQYNGGTTPQGSENRMSVFSAEMSSMVNPLGLPNTVTSPSSLMGPAAAVGGPSLRAVHSGPLHAHNSQPLGMGGVGPVGSLASTVSHQVLTPMLDLFSHLREPLSGPQSAGGLGAPQPPSPLDGMANGSANGNGIHNSAGGGYAGMLLRSSPPGASTPGSLMSPSGGANGGGPMGLQSASSLGSQLGGAAPGPMLMSGGGARMGPPGPGQSPPGQPGLMMPQQQHMSGAGGLHGGPHSLPSPQSQQQQQAAAAAANLGLARISIRDSLRLALGRLEEMVTCPITGEIMRDPVVAADGYSYERSAIQAWMSAHNMSPLSGEALQHKMLIPNRLAKDIIADILP